MMGAIGKARFQCHTLNDVGFAIDLPETIGTVVCVVPGALDGTYPWGRQ
jgi:hypothetical protein